MSSDNPRELFGTPDCPFTAEARAQLEWEGTPFVEYDFAHDPAAHARMLALTGGQRTVPVVVDGDRVVEIGWRGRGCLV